MPKAKRMRARSPAEDEDLVVLVEDGVEAGVGGVLHHAAQERLQRRAAAYTVIVGRT